MLVPMIPAIPPTANFAGSGTFGSCESTARCPTAVISHHIPEGCQPSPAATIWRPNATGSIICNTCNHCTHRRPFREKDDVVWTINTAQMSCMSPFRVQWRVTSDVSRVRSTAKRMVRILTTFTGFAGAATPATETDAAAIVEYATQQTKEVIKRMCFRSRRVELQNQCWHIAQRRRPRPAVDSTSTSSAMIALARGRRTSMSSIARDVGVDCKYQWPRVRIAEAGTVKSITLA